MLLGNDVMERRQSKQHWNYRDLVSYKLPRQPRLKKKSSKDLFSVKIVEEQGSRVKVHYIGYSCSYDEWRNREEIELLDSEVAEEPESTQGMESEAIATTRYNPFSLFNELLFKIKSGLSCNRKVSPKIKITMPFDLVAFNGSFKVAGTPSRKIGGTQYYTISNYQDLNHWLGPNWHYRGINQNGDYDYVLKETFEFCIRKRKSFVEYVPSSSSPRCITTDTGYSLSVSFTCGYGNAETFGKDRSIFV